MAVLPRKNGFDTTIVTLKVKSNFNQMREEDLYSSGVFTSELDEDTSTEMDSGDIDDEKFDEDEEDDEYFGDDEEGLDNGAELPKEDDWN